MTVSSTETKTIYGGNGSTAVFAIPFMFMRDEDVEVSLIKAKGTELNQTLGTDYQLTGAGEQTGGTCALSTTPQVGETVVIRRNPAIVQEVDYLENDAFPAASHEAALDKLTMICQALSERLDRTISFRVSSAVNGVNLPDPVADRFLAWNTEGTNLENKDVLECGSISVPVPVNQGGTGADNVTEALFNLGFGAVGAAVAGCDTGDEIVEAIDTDLLRADRADILQAVFGDEAQTVHGEFAVTLNRNHVLWTLDTDHSLPGIDRYPYDGTYVIHAYPSGHIIYIPSNYKLPVEYAEPSANAGEVRIVVEKFNGRVSIVSIQNIGA